MLCRKRGLLSGGTSVVFMWVPSHIELAGNSPADIAAKATLLLHYQYLTRMFLIRITTRSYILRHKNSGNYVGIVKLRTSCMQLNQG